MSGRITCLRSRLESFFPTPTKNDSTPNEAVVSVVLLATRGQTRKHGEGKKKNPQNKQSKQTIFGKISDALEQNKTRKDEKAGMTRTH